MANQLPLYVNANGQLIRFQSGDYLAVAQGGTGGQTVAAAQSSLQVTPGTYTQAYSASLTAVAALSATGIAVMTGSNTWALRTIVSGGTLTVTNPAGTAANFSLDLSTVANSGTGSFYKFAIDTYGRVTGTTPVVVGDLTSLLSGVYLPLSGGTLTGALVLSGDPTAALGAATKQYVDGVASGMQYKDSVVAASGANVTTTAPGFTALDGVTLANGNRILLLAQTTASQNGVWIYNGSAAALTRPSDWATGSTTDVVGGTTTWVNGGAVYGDTAWTVVTTGTITVDTTSVSLTQTSGLGQVVAGNGLTKSGNTMSVLAASSRIVTSGSGIDLGTSGATAGTYSLVTVDAYGRVTTGATATPADVGAQPSSALLTALAGLSPGLVAVTGASTATNVTIAGTAGQIVVANGNGVAGAPTLGLATTGVTAGTYNGVTVDAYGRVLSGTSSSTSFLSTSLTNGTASAIAIGSAVYISGAGTVGLANANASTTSGVVGLVSDVSIAASAAGNVAVSGVVTATTTQWDSVTGQTGGLTFGAYYFLSNVTAGYLTTTAPTSGLVCMVGVALSTTQLKLQIERPIQL